MTVPQLRGGDCSTYIGLRRGDSAGGRDLLREGIEENVQRKRRKKTVLFWYKKENIFFKEKENFFIFNFNYFFSSRLV
jgi:hypothetical protein